MSAVINAIDAEIAEVETDIVRNPDPRLKRLAHLRSVKKIYLDENVIVPGAPLATSETVVRGNFDMFVARNKADVATIERFQEGVSASLRLGGRRPSPERQRALAAAKEFLAGKSEPTKTTVVLDYLNSRDIPVPGTDPINNLSAMLSTDPRFRSKGRNGWTLDQAQEAAS